ncbi:hypothetical protein CerSpe_230540 [Prunus speciosa]
MAWLEAEDKLLRSLARRFQGKKMSFWTTVCSFFPNKSEQECKQRLAQVDGLHYAPHEGEWSTADDENLLNFYHLIPKELDIISRAIGDCDEKQCKKRLLALGLGPEEDGLKMDVDVAKGEEVDMIGEDNDLDISSKGKEVDMMYGGGARDQDPSSEDNNNVMRGNQDYTEELPKIQNNNLEHFELDLSFTKLFNHLFAEKEMRILMIGLDAAGKTTILYKLKLGEIVTTIPTIGFNVETMDYKNISFTVWDVGAQDKIQTVWRKYLQNIQGVIFVVDSDDRQRMVEAKNQLHMLLSEDVLRDVVVVVFANKQDLLNAMVPHDIGDKLNLHSLRQRHRVIQPTCGTSGSGLYEGLEWLSKRIANKEAPQNVRR